MNASGEEDSPPGPDAEGFEEILARMALPSTPAEAIGRDTALVQEIQNWKRNSAVATISGMLTDVRFHAHVVRLDWLQRLVVAQANGKKKPKRKDLAQALNKGMGTAGIAMMEDPIEGFFVEVVPTKHLDALIFGGHWETAAQYTETVIRAFERLSDSPLKVAALSKVYALLRLSTALVDRSKLERRSKNEGEPKADIKVPTDDGLQALGRRVRFSNEELAELGIARQDLESYILLPEQFGMTGDEEPGNSVLDYFPLIAIDGGILVANPGSMSLAARATLLQTAQRGGVGDAFVERLAHVQEDFSESTGFFGGELRLRPIDDFNLRATVVRVAAGRYVHVIQVVPDLAYFMSSGFGGIAELREGADAAIAREVSSFWNFLSRQRDNRESVTVILLSGWGGSMAVSPDIDESAAPPSWQYIALTFADAATMGACEDGKLRDLRRMFDQLSILGRAGYEIQRLNGSINLFGNWRATDGNFVPEHWDADPPAMLYLPIDDLMKVRIEGEENRDVRAVARPDGTREVMQRMEWERNGPLKPIYGSLESIPQGKLAGTVNLSGRTWWIEASTEAKEGEGREWQFQIWNSVIQWMGTSAETLIAAFPKELGLAPAYVRVVMTGGGRPEFADNPTEGEAADHLHLVTASDGVCEVRIAEGWMHFLRRVTNDAELALATSVVIQLAAANGETLDASVVEAQIRIAIPSSDWRYLHAHEVRYPLDRLSARGLYPPFKRIPKSAAALVRCGSVWRFWDRANGHQFSGEEACRTFLITYYDFILAELIQQIRRFDRERLTRLCANRYASARLEHDRWRRTIRAMRSIHGSEIDADALQRISEFNAVQRGAKTIAEIAACESPTEGGLDPGRDDTDEMFSRAILSFGNGQLYATIRGGLVRPELKISPGGDLLSDRSNFQKSFVPASMRANTRALDEASEAYVARFEPREDANQPEDLPWGEEFRAAIAAEYQCSAEAFVDIQMVIIQLCEAAGSGMLTMRRSELALAITSNEAFPDRNVDHALKRLTLERRDDWTARPEGYSARDLELWRFDRKYSLINRPLLAISSDEDPILLVSPVFVSDATMYQLSGMHYATVHDDTFWSSKEARAYAGKRAKEIGSAFEDKVASVLNGASFDAKPRQKLTALLQDSVEGDLGDVDVFAISPSRHHVFVIEAKNLKLCRTEVEVTARMSDYAGKMRSDSKGNEKPDRLLRHIRRVQYVRARAERLADRLGLPDTPQVHGLMVVDAPQPMNFFMLEETPDAHSCILDDLVQTARVIASDG